MFRFHKRTIIILGALIGVLMMTNFAYAKARITPGDKTAPYTSAASCDLCHGDGPSRLAYGPHGGYTTVTTNCTTCHTIHSNSSSTTIQKTAVNTKLLPGVTVTATCQFCHDLTATNLTPYSTANMTTSSDIKAAHRVKGIASYNGVIDNWVGYSEVPGGDANTGGSITFIPLQGELSGSIELTCDSCHTPHGINTVKPFLGESERKATTLPLIGMHNNQIGYSGYFITNRLLKNRLQVGSAVYSEYGSAWCAGCHQGRTHTLGDGNFNHPVNLSSAAYNWGLIANDRGILLNGATIDDINSGTEITVTGRAPINVVVSADVYGLGVNPLYQVKLQLIGSNGFQYPSLLSKLTADPRSNRWYTMTIKDTISGNSRPDGYKPITAYPNGPACQQCHASARDVEEAFSAGVNPETDSFPHISVKKSLLVENDDDLCTNCHGIDNLP